MTHYIAVHLGTLGELACIRMEISVLIANLSHLVMFCPITKGAATEPMGIMCALAT
jgi:hypothetical protein